MVIGLEILSYVLLVVFALVPIANPFSTAPLFVSMTSGTDKEQRQHIALLSCFYMFLILTLFFLLGSVVLNFFGISLPSLRIAGGLIVATIGFRMVFDQGKNERQGKVSADDLKKIAFTPLAMPMLSGPGSISVVMSMSAQIAQVENTSHQLYGHGVVIIGIAISALICWLVLRASGVVVKYLGTNGIDEIGRASCRERVYAPV